MSASEQSQKGTVLLRIC